MISGPLAMLIAFSPLIASALWIAALTVAVFRVGRGRDARELTRLALFFSVIGGLSFAFWPLWVGISVSGQIAVDPSTGAHTSTSSQQITFEAFPYLRLLGVRALFLAAIPVAVTALAYLWQRMRFPAMTAMRVICLFALAAWFIVGSVSAVSWWSIPGAAALLLAATRSKPSAGAPA